jgi:hypothetical protein
MSGSSLQTSTISKMLGKKKNFSAMWYTKIVNVMFHQLCLHTMQNTNRYKSRHLRFKGYSSDVSENSGPLGCDVVDNGGMLPGTM